MMFGAFMVDKVMKVDDAVGAVPVHFFGGMYGILAVGIFADGTYGGVQGLITGHWGQLLLQLVNIGTCIAWVGITMTITFWIIKKTIGLRATRKEELSGLDMPEHGIESYPKDDVGLPQEAIGLPGKAYLKADEM
jgi:Amt family ammonium transporter